MGGGCPRACQRRVRVQHGPNSLTRQDRPDRLSATPDKPTPKAKTLVRVRASPISPQDDAGLGGGFRAVADSLAPDFVRVMGSGSMSVR